MSELVIRKERGWFVVYEVAPDGESPMDKFKTRDEALEFMARFSQKGQIGNYAERAKEGTK